MRRGGLPFIITLVLIAAGPTSADELNLHAVTGEHPNLLHVETGMDYAFTVEIGYGRVFEVADRPLILGASLTTPWATPDLADYRATVGGTVAAVESGPWGLLTGLDLHVRGGSADYQRMTGIALNPRVVGGYFRRGFIAIELGYDWTFTNHIRHTDRYRDAVFEDARDGWYGPTGSHLSYGLYGGYSFERVDLVLRVWQTRDLNFDTPLAPAFATVGANFRL